MHFPLSSLLLIPLVSAASIEITIPPTAALPNPNTLNPSSTRAYLASSGEPLLASLTRQNTFFFPAVPPGSHLLTVVSRDNLFENLRVDVSVDTATGLETVEAWTTYRGNEWSNKGETRSSGDASSGKARIEVKSVSGKAYYVERQGFSLMSIFSNPMILIGIVTLVMVVGMPYLMDNLDPEVKAEFEAMQKQNQGMTSQATNLHNMDIAGDLATWLSGTGSKGETQPASAGNAQKAKR